MKNLVFFFLCLEAACSSWGCGLQLGGSDCEREAAAVEAAAVRCGMAVQGHLGCDGVLASTVDDIDACVAWHETVSCEELAVDTYWLDKCQPKLLVSPL